MDKKFAVAINCMDGRVQRPVFDYLAKSFNVDFVDMVTEAGPNKILSERNNNILIESIRERVEISVKKHYSKTIAIMGHYDCVANVVSEDVQRKQIIDAVRVISNWNLAVDNIIGIWVDKGFKDCWRVI